MALLRQSPPEPSVQREHTSPAHLAILALHLLAAAWLSLSGGLLFWSTAPAAAGWQPRLILSGSMEPDLHPGDVVLTTHVPDTRTLIRGQVLAVADPTRPAGSYLHRLARQEPDGRLVTRGDANRTDDFPPATPDRVQGLGRVVIPTVGKPLLLARQGNPTLLIVVVLATVAAIALLGSPPAGTTPRQPIAPHGPPGPLDVHPTGPAPPGQDPTTGRRRRDVHDTRRILAQLAVPAFILMSVAALLTWTPMITALTTLPADQLVTLDRYLPTSATATLTPTPTSTATTPSTCHVAWTPAADTPPQVHYDVTDESGRALATDIHGTTTWVHPHDPTQTLSIRTRIDAWTSAHATTTLTPCQGPNRISGPPRHETARQAF